MLVIEGEGVLSVIERSRMSAILQESSQHLEEQLEAEERAHQKALLDKTSAEQKLKAALKECDELGQSNQKVRSSSERR